LQGIEKTLRDTLTKLGSPNEVTRLKLYKATETILERSLSPYFETQPDMVTARRSQLREIIGKLEDEYIGLTVTPNVVPQIRFDALQLLDESGQCGLCALEILSVPNEGKAYFARRSFYLKLHIP